jgi:hypothetical protein
MYLQKINKYISSHNELPYLQIMSYFSNYLILFIINHLLLSSYNNIYIQDIYIASQITLLFHLYVQYHRETHLLNKYMYRDNIYNKATVKPPLYYLLSSNLFFIIYVFLFIINCTIMRNYGLTIIHTISSSTIMIKTYYNIKYNRSLLNRPIYYYSNVPRNSYIEHFKNIEYPTQVYM